MTNYICINGKKAELTEEQMKALGIELPKAKSPFERAGYKENYYYIGSTGEVAREMEASFCNDKIRFNTANYCTDKAIMEQRALHETLSRLLWRYSMEHDGDKIDWEDDYVDKFWIRYDNNRKRYDINKNQFINRIGTVYFHTADIAQAAIEEIIKPFMKAHPEFKW